MKSPAERPVVAEPLALHLEHLLYYIAGTAVTAITPADIDTCLLHLSTRIGRTTGASAKAHHLEIGDITGMITVESTPSLDFKGGNKVYGNNGCNTINGTFQLNGNNLMFSDFITTDRQCHNVTSEKTIMHTLADVRRYSLETQYNAQYLNLMNSKGAVIMVLKRHNLDAMNGAWLIKEIDSENVSELNMRVVVDAVMQTIHGDTGCNIINGIITLDPTKDMAIQFEDLHSTENDCEEIEYETSLLLALERTESCKRINQNEMALLDNKGTIVVVLQRLNLR